MDMITGKAPGPPSHEPTYKNPRRSQERAAHAVGLEHEQLLDLGPISDEAALPPRRDTVVGVEVVRLRRSEGGRRESTARAGEPTVHRLGIDGRWAVNTLEDQGKRRQGQRERVGDEVAE